MPVLRIQDFSGIVPVKGDRAIPDGYATESVNTWLYGSELRGVRPPVHLTNVVSTTRKVLRIPLGTVGGDPMYPSVVPPPSYLGDSVWIQFDDKDTDIVKGALVEDQYNRWYFCSPSRGPEFNTFARMKLGLSNYKLGVIGPDNTITVGATPDNAWRPKVDSVTGGADPKVTRSYVYTWMNEFGEESAPSLPVTFTGFADGVWNISNILAPPAPPAGYPAYAKKWLYRTATGTGGGWDYYRVSEVPLATTTFVDSGVSRPDTAITMNLTLESVPWRLPPPNLQGWICMPNGFLIAFDKAVETPPGSNNWVGGNNVYMSEAYRFHAWPGTYKFATESLVVGLGILGQTCVVATQGYPATITGIKPSACTFAKATVDEPCLSRSSIVSSPQGVIYASQNGLINVGPNGIQNVTEGLIEREEWLKSYMPQYLRGVRYQSGYLALRMPPTPGTRSGYFIDPTSLKVALTEFSDLTNVRNFVNDFWSGEIFLLMNDGELLRWDPPVDSAGNPNHDLMPVLWKSKEFQFPYEENFGAYAVYWDPARYSDNAYGSSVLPVGEQVHLKVYANRFLVYDEEVPRCGRPVRLPSGFKGDLWQFELRGRAPIYSLHVASTIKELKGV
jgi:hypothetical protein